MIQLKPTKYRAKKVTLDGITFDSQMESEYYLYLKQMESLGEIISFVRQPVYTLQEAFVKDGRKYKAIEYKADFSVLYADGRQEIVDVKGFETTDFSIKRKLFDKRYPEHTLKLLTECPKKYGGGWIEVGELKKLRKDAKR